jgi:hypothetical protein
VKGKYQYLTTTMLFTFFSSRVVMTISTNRNDK